MQSTATLRRSIRTLALLTGSVLALALMLPLMNQWWAGVRYNPERVSRIVNAEMLSLEQALDDLGSGSVPGGQEGEEIFRKEGKAFFHFSGDSLAWWSTDGVPAPVGAKAEAVSQGLVFIANGYYLGRELQRGTDHWLGLQLVYRDFAYRNEYLTPSFHPVLGIPEGAVLRFTPDRGAVHGPGGEYLFSVLPGEGQRMGLPEALPAILWMLAYTLLLGLLYRAYLLLLRSPSRNLLILLGFTVDALLLRAVLLYFKQPSGLYGLDLFQPEHYASSVFTPSLGDLVLHALTLTWIAWVLFIHLPLIPLPMVRKRAMRLLAQLLVQGLVLGLFILATLQIDILVRDSSIAFDLNDLFSLNEYSLIGFASVFLIFFSFLLAGSRLTAWLAGQGKAWEYFLLPFLALVMALVWPFSTVQRASLLIYLLGIISWWLYHRRLGLRNPVGAVLCFLLLFSGLLSIKLGSSLQQREQGKRRLIAIRLTQQRDQVGEYIFGAMRKELRADTTFQRLLVQATEASQDGGVKEYLDENYIRDYWQRYEMNVTVCATGRLLDVQPSGYIVDCGEYFSGLIRNLGKPTVTDSLYYIDLGGDNSSYLSVMEFRHLLPSDVPMRVYLEIFPRHIPKGLGYPELLIDEAWMPEDISGYSYAVYRHGALARRVGGFFYSLGAQTYLEGHGNGEFFDMDGYNHYLRVVDEDTVVLLSLPQKSMLDKVAPFSYLLVFTALLLILVYLASEGGWRGLPWSMSLRSRLQVSMVAVILVTFVVVALSSLWFLVRINKNKNESSLSEKAHSVLVELEHKMADRDRLDPEERQWMEQLLSKFSLVFFSDINMYNPQGEVIASSRPRIFDEGLIGTRMNAGAWEQLNRGQSLVIQEERIGSYTYLSTYLPFRNNRNELLAYINLPYFARQAELRQEISDFMVAIINIYVILIALTLGAALFISNLFTRPLQLIRDKIKRVRLGSANERIEWQRRDEIGALVEEYNRMVDALAESAESLARTERETAWREMARQVAHEIKNPLTPMKLSVQYLQKAWDEKAGDWDTRLQRFTATLSEQIDTLSDIATAFSDFARMPGNESEPTDLARVARHAMDTFSEGSHHAVHAHWETSLTCPVFADPRQLLRVFNNLLKNALQALGDQPEGEVSVGISAREEHFLVSVSDNGPGIPEDKRDKIFVPNFTTKSGGTGLGLAMTRNIVVAHGGRIWYETAEGQGTTFFFTLPRLRPENERDTGV